MAKKATDKLSIAMLGHKRVPSREGGIEVVVGELATRMVSLGHSVTCYNRKGHHIGGAEFDTEHISEYEGVRLKNVLTIHKRGLAAVTSSFSAAICAAFGKYDVVHFHAEGPCAAMWIPKLFGKRCIATIHGLDHQRAKWGRFAGNYILSGEKCAVKMADEIIVLSENIQKYFMDTYKRETKFIPNGIDRPVHCKADIITENFGVKEGEYFLYLGRLVPEKGLKYLIEAYKQIDTDKKLVIAGGASDTDEFVQELRELAEDDPRIIFTGFIQGKTLNELFSNAYVYVLPSDLEGMPISLLEAMSYGNCCLTSDIPECTGVIDDYGVTFKRGDVSDLRDKLKLLSDSPETVNRYKDTTADFICKKFDWDKITQQTLALYRDNSEV